MNILHLVFLLAYLLHLHTYYSGRKLLGQAEVNADS